jgi:hypothetical protein
MLDTNPRGSTCPMLLKTSTRILNHGNERCFPYLNIDVCKIVLGKEILSETDVDAQ